MSYSPLFCVVKNETFEVVEIKNYKDPSNFVIGKYYTGIPLNYKIANTGVEVISPNSKNKTGVISFLFDGTKLINLIDPNMQNVADYFNKFNAISKEELDELVIEAQRNEKTTLKQEKENIKIEKENLEEKISIYHQIQNKKEEIKELMSKIDNY